MSHIRVGRREFLKRTGAAGLALASMDALPRLVGTSGTTAALAGERTTLSLIYAPRGDPDRTALQEMLREFERRNPGTNVEVELTTVGRLPEVIQTRLVSRNLPDVAYLVGNRVPAYNKLGILADVSSSLPPDIGDEFVAYRWAEVQFGSRIVGVPIGHGVRALAYNVDYFQKAGIEAPRSPDQAWTWDQFVDVAQRLMRSTDAKFGLMFEDNSFDHWAGIHYQAGGTLLNRDMTAPAINSPEGLEALEWAIDLHRRKIAPPGVVEGTQNPYPLFTSGAVGMWMIGAFAISALESQMTRHRYNFTYMPRKKRAAVVTTGGVWTVFRTRQLEQASKLLVFLASEESITKLAGARAQNSARKRARGLRWPAKSELVEFFGRQADAAFQPQLQKETILPFYGATRDALTAELGLAISGQKSAKQALQDMERLIASELK